MPRPRSNSSSSARAEWKSCGSAASVLESGSRNIGVDLEVSVFRQGKTEITIVEMHHQLALDKLLDRSVDPRCVFKLRRDLLRAVCIGAILVKLSVTIRIARNTGRTVAPVLNQDRGPRFSITEVRFRPLSPAI